MLRISREGQGIPESRKWKQGASATPCFGRGGAESCLAAQAPPISFIERLATFVQPRGKSWGKVDGGDGVPGL